VPTIWLIPPDGCEHWWMDDGPKATLTPKSPAKAFPVCRPFETCASLNSDKLLQRTATH